MQDFTEIWKSIAGVAIFLLGMNFLEEGLRQVAGRPFKLFLRKHTSNKLKAIGGGAIVTGILQSSSIVNLMVLAFVGTGVIQMQNALAIILGANLGTTINSWIIATVGFSFNIEDFALPIAGVSGLLMMLVNKESLWYQWCRLIFGFSFLFIGLNYIKTGIEATVNQQELISLNDHPAIIFLFVGFLLTSLTQSSSVTVAITLSALHANAISLFSATAIVLGAEVGTTIKLVLASLKGIAAKKMVAMGNLWFNIISTLIVFIFLLPINRFITNVAGIGDNLIALVFFQSLVNLVGIILFYPFLGIFGRFLERRFSGNDEESRFISKVPVTDGELALQALEKETQNFFYHVLSFMAAAFESDYKVPEKMQHKSFERKLLMEKYKYIKVLHGEIHRFSVKLQGPGIKEPEKLTQLISCLRNCMYAAKNISDILNDINQLGNSSNDTKYNYFLKNKIKVDSFCRQAAGLMEKQNASQITADITGIYKEIQVGYTQSLQELYKEGLSRHVNQVEISTLINFNRELYTAFKSMTFALKDYLLDPAASDDFENLPGFIR